MTSPDSCGRCHRLMLRSHRREPGYVKHAAHGLCTGCYGRDVIIPRKMRTSRDSTEPYCQDCGSAHIAWEPLIDWAAVERATRGGKLQLTTAEVTEVVTRLTRRGMSGRDIAPYIGVSYRTVVRARARHRAQQRQETEAA